MSNVECGARPSRVEAGLEARMDAVLEQALSERRLVGAVVLAVKDGAPVYRRAAGWADREAGLPMREDALFRLASVSKPIVSTAAMVLAARQRLDLDEDIARWLPAFRPRLADGSPARITPRQLLSHTAGLGYRFFEADEDGPYARAGVSDGMDADGLSLTENLRRIASVPLMYPPGQSWAYSLATDILGALVERVADEPLPQAVRRWVTAPLGMNDTDFYALEPQRLAAVYVNGEAEPWRMEQPATVAPFDGTVGIRFAPERALDSGAYPSGGAGMVGSADDFLRLLEALRQGGAPLLPPKWVEEMARNHTGSLELPEMPGFGFGLGFSVLRDPAAAASPESPGTWRWGGAYGHSWFVDRARGLSVLAFTNTLYEGMSGRFVADLRDAVYGVEPLLQ